MLEFSQGEGNSGTVILPAHLLVLEVLKHLAFFSVDTVERDGPAVEKDKSQSSPNIMMVLARSIERI
jgi:hypothetical protein